jgi:exopolysaccharide production protein ExoZ
MTDPSAQRDPLRRVQMLRAIAALSVAIRHAQHDAATLAERSGASFAPWDPIPWSAGVDVFFVISGLIMVHASQGLFARPQGPRIFLARRIARIVPLYWSVTTLYLIALITAPDVLNQTYVTVGFVIKSYLFIPAARPDGWVQPLYELGWTLNYEMFFYALFAASIVLPARRACVSLLCVLVSLVIGGRLIDRHAQPSAFWTDPIILEFGFGVAIGLARASGLRISRLAAVACVGLGVAALAFAAHVQDVLDLVARPLAYGVPAFLIVAGFALTADAPHRESAAARCAVAAGDASYALYLLHPFVIRGVGLAFERTGAFGFLGAWIYIAAALGGSLGAAFLCYRFFERPLTEHARRLLRAGSRRENLRLA